MDDDGYTALAVAAGRCQVAMVSLLLARRAFCGAVASDGYGPLREAAGEGHIEIVSLLLAHGADVNANDPWGETALLVATCNGHLEVITALLDAAASTNQCDSRGDNCLTVAAKQGNVDVARLLINAGALPDARPAQGDPPLLAAARRGHLSFVRFLVSARASVNLRNDDGCSAVELAFENHHYVMVEFFIESGAFLSAPILQDIEREADISRWSAEMQRIIAAAHCDTSLWTDLDKIVQRHRYNLTSIASWPLDVCVVAQPTDRASLLLGSVHAAAALDVIRRGHGIAVNVVVTLCNPRHMNVHGARRGSLGRDSPRPRHCRQRRGHFMQSQAHERAWRAQRLAKLFCGKRRLQHSVPHGRLHCVAHAHGHSWSQSIATAVFAMLEIGVFATVAPFHACCFP
eukprot:s2112_g17.t1